MAGRAHPMIVTASPRRSIAGRIDKVSYNEDSVYYILRRGSLEKPYPSLLSFFSLSSLQWFSNAALEVPDAAVSTFGTISCCWPAEKSMQGGGGTSYYSKPALLRRLILSRAGPINTTISCESDSPPWVLGSL